MDTWYRRELGAVIAVVVCLIVGRFGRQQAGVETEARVLAAILFGFLSIYAWRDKIGSSHGRMEIYLMSWVVVVAGFRILLPKAKNLGD
jgi:4-amino-4-deoxy-L-arabinose transferase-like glycosyltransferase